MLMTYEQILVVKEYEGVAITDKIIQEAIEMTEQLDLLSYHEGLDIVLDDKGLIKNEIAEEVNSKAKKVQKEMTKAKGEKKPKADTLAKVKTLKAKKKVDICKDEIFEELEKFAKLTDCIKFAQTVKNGQISFMDTEGSFYSIKLTKHKTKPDGYAE
ncbi:MAG: hypothetical protein RR952_06645 [Cetobacterium sp.]